MKRIAIVIFLLVFVLLASGCQNNDKASDKTTNPVPTDNGKPPEPVTLMLYEVNGISDELMEKWFNAPLRKKYPHIKVEKIPKANNTIQNVIATNQQIDLVSLSSYHIPFHADLGILADMTSFIKSNNFDLERFDTTSLNFIKSISKGGIYALPYTAQAAALYYNKDIFDKFGVAYPSDGMTWENSIELAKRLTRVSDGVQYRGLEVQDLLRLMAPLSLNYVNSKTNRSELNSAPFKRVFELAKTIADIPGNRPYEVGGNLNAFLKDRTLAMLAATNWLKVDAFVQNAPTMNWDIAQYPSYADLPNRYLEPDLGTLAMAETSKHKDAVMKVLEVFYQEDVQLISSRTGSIVPLKDAKYKEQFAADLPFAKGKNLQAYFKSRWADGSVVTKYQSSVGAFATKEFTAVINGTKDVNTALRDAEEAINKFIISEEAK